MTSEVNMINLQVIAADQIAIDRATIDKASGKSVYDLNVAQNSKHYTWQSEYQTIPMGMDGEPRQFAQKLRESLPEVNNLRMLFNEFSFDENGELHPQYQAFLEESVKQGFEITFVLGSGDAQNIGNGGSPWGHESLTNAQAYDHLEDNFKDLKSGWNSLLNWLEGQPEIADGVYGLELANEPAGYRRSIKENGDGDGYVYADFVKLYADHMVELSDMIQAQSDARVLVGGWGYSGDFATLANTVVNDKTGQSALDYISESVGDALIWSAHLYPGWVGTNAATSTDELTEMLESHFALLRDQDVLITETNATGLVNDYSGGHNVVDLFVSMYEWFAANDIGIGWFPGAEAGGSNFVVIDQDGSLRFLHQHSYAHGMNAFSQGETDAALAGNDRIRAELVEGRLRNETYEKDYAEGAFDTEELLGSAFGYEGDDKLIGTKLSNDFLYGGFGNDTLIGKAGDDFLFGQQGNDVLTASSGVDHLFGGSGNDRLIGGRGYDQFHGGAGNDVFVSNGKGQDVITDFDAGDDRIDLLGRLSGWSEISANITKIDADGDGAKDDLEIALGGRKSLTFLDVSQSELSAEHFIGAKPADGVISGTVSHDLIGSGGYEDSQGEAVSRGDDIVFGLSGDDTIYGYKGNDEIYGGMGADIIYSGSGDDYVEGAKGGDVINGGGGDDRLFGGDGRDNLIGGKGADRLEGGAGNDVLKGGGGADSFVFTNGDGKDKIKGFSALKDEIHLVDADSYTLRETSGGVKIHYDDKAAILLKGVFLETEADLQALEDAIHLDLG
ncbi:M10 family metallopeptidase C-terminal domain-containing protein [Neptunicoccus sediminis]|uniref:M10 family metallopeptidase C-terminal domain-containing protein n=1 Tax=Neptunicoccus sediminis TaxID=1892596 RepID=UPI0008460077|nr:hypothetical protein [Neptunicoccus sediminis]